MDGREVSLLNPSLNLSLNGHPPPRHLRNCRGSWNSCCRLWFIVCLSFFLINKTNNTLDKSWRWKRLWTIKTIPTLELLILPTKSLLNLSLNPAPFFPPFTSKKLARRGSWNSWCSLCLWPRWRMPACCCPAWPRVTLHHASAGCLETSCWKRGTCRATLIYCLMHFSILIDKAEIVKQKRKSNRFGVSPESCQ